MTRHSRRATLVVLFLSITGCDLFTEGATPLSITTVIRDATFITGRPTGSVPPLSVIRDEAEEAEFLAAFPTSRPLPGTDYSVSSLVYVVLGSPSASALVDIREVRLRGDETIEIDIATEGAFSQDSTARFFPVHVVRTDRIPASVRTAGVSNISGQE